MRGQAPFCCTGIHLGGKRKRRRSVSYLPAICRLCVGQAAGASVRYLDPSSWEKGCTEAIGHRHRQIGNPPRLEHRAPWWRPRATVRRPWRRLVPTTDTGATRFAPDAARIPKARTEGGGAGTADAPETAAKGRPGPGPPLPGEGSQAFLPETRDFEQKTCHIGQVSVVEGENWPLGRHVHAGRAPGRSSPVVREEEGRPDTVPAARNAAPLRPATPESASYHTASPVRPRDRGGAGGGGEA